MASPTANPFDQFDGPAPTKQDNPFDQFDFGSYPSVIARGVARGAIDTTATALKGLPVIERASEPGNLSYLEGSGGGTMFAPPENPQPQTPITETAPYKAGQAVRQFGERRAPMTAAEEQSFTGKASRMAGGAVPFVAGALLAPEVALPAGATVFASSSAASSFDDFKTRGASDEDAAKGAGLSAIVGGGLGVLPLGAILAPVRRTAPGMVGWALTKLEQALQSGATFGTVGEAQKFLDEEIKRHSASDYVGAPVDAFGSTTPQGVEAATPAGYTFDPKSYAASIAAGGALGVVHPLAAPRVSTPEEIAAFNRAASAAPGAEKTFSQTRADIDEFLRTRAEREAAAARDAGQLQLPPPAEPGESAPQAAAPQPEAPSGGETFPSFEEPGRTSPAAAPNPFDQFEQPTVEIPSAAPAEPQPPAPRTDVGPHVLQALLDDPRSAAEIRGSIDARKAAGDQGSTPIQTEVNPQPLAQALDQTPDINHVSRETPGSRDLPVALEGPEHVLAGAEHTAEPTPGQADAGNYRKRHVTWNGLDLTVETEAGMERRGTGADGQPWSVTLTSPYGYIKGTKGRDGEQVDVYLGPQPQSPHVFIVDQIDPATGRFDEHKALVGFPDEASARAAYQQAFSDNSAGSRLGALQSLTVEGFKDWLRKGQRREPLAYSDTVGAAQRIAREIGVNATAAEVEEAARIHKGSNADLTDVLVAVIERNAIAEEAESADSVQRHEANDGRQVEPAAENTSGAQLAPAGEPTGRPGAQEVGEAPAGIEPGEAERDRRAAGERLDQRSGFSPSQLKTLLDEEDESLVGMWHQAREPMPPDASDQHSAYVSRITKDLDRLGVLHAATEQEVRDLLMDRRLRKETVQPRGSEILDLQAEPERPALTAPVTRDAAPAEPEITPLGTTAATLTKLIPKIAKMSDADRADVRQRVATMMADMEAEGRKIAEHCVETGGKFSVRR